MPFEEALTPRPQIEPSAAMELSWLLFTCSGCNHEMFPEALQARVDAFWGDGYGVQPELLVVAQQLECLTGWEIDPLFSLERHRLRRVADVDMRTEAPEVCAAIADRLERLRQDKDLRRRYSQLLSETWEHGREEWESLGRPTVERALFRMRASLDHGLAPINLIPDRHIAVRQEWVGLTLAALSEGTLLLSPCYFASEYGHTIALPGLLSIAIATGVTQDMARRRTEIEDIARGLKILSDPTRLLILTELDREPTTVGDIARRVNVAQATASVHVKQLREAGFISGGKEANGVAVYHVQQERIRQALDAAVDATLTPST